jgi:hypothetical protein
VWGTETEWGKEMEMGMAKVTVKVRAMLLELGLVTGMEKVSELGLMLV